MSEKNNKKPVVEEVPGWVKKAPELLPVWDWWVKEGRSTLTLLLVGGICVAGWYAFKNWQASRTAQANAALVNSFTADELEEAVAKFGSSATGPALKLRLAKSYFDAERYEEAEKIYADYTAAADKDDAFVPLAALGRAYALEGAGKYDEASAAYAALAGDTNTPVHATAELGVARCMALKGDKTGALKKLEAMDDPRAKNLIETVKRYDPTRKKATLFDAADAAALKIDAEKKPAAADTTAKPAVKADSTKPAAEKK